MGLTISDVKDGVHDGICSCGTRLNPRTGEECVDAAQEAIERAVILKLFDKGALHYLTVNDEGNCRHLLSGCWYRTAGSATPVPAVFAGTCPDCGEAINKDDWIVRTSRGSWIHERCES